MATGALGKAYIEVHADTKPFAKEIQKELKTILAATQKQADAAGREFGKRLGASAGQHTRSEFKKSLDQISRDVQRVKITKKIDVNVDRNNVKQVERAIGSIGSRIDKATDLVESFFSAFGRGAMSAGNALINLASNINPIQVLLYALLALLGVGLVGVVFVLIGAFGKLVGLIGFLPGALAAVLAIVAPLVIAFHGLSDALEAVFENDPEKLNEALKKLTPSARGFVLEIKKALPVLSAIKATVQENFFAPLQGAITAITKSLGPTFVTGLGMVATQLGLFFQGLAALAASPAIKSFFEELFFNASFIVTTLSGPVLNLIAALAEMANAAAPIISSIAFDFGSWIDNLASFITQHVKDGSFQQWLKDAYQGFKDVWAIVKGLWDILVYIYLWYKSDGEDLIDGIKTFILDLQEWFKSDDGQTFLEGLRVAAAMFGFALGTVVAALVIVVYLLGKAAELWNWLTDNGAPGTKNAKSGSYNPEDYDASEFGGNYPVYDDGGIVNRKTLSWLAKDNKEEVVIPLTKPNRARQLVQDSGLMDVVGGGGGGDVYVYVGNEQLDSRTYRVASQAMNAQATALAAGPRGDI